MKFSRSVSLGEEMGNYILPVINGGTGTSNGSISGNDDLKFASALNKILQLLTGTSSLLPRLTILQNGNIGIGTETPGTILNIKDTSDTGTTQLLLEQLSGSTTKAHFGQFGNDLYIYNNYYYKSGHHTDDATLPSVGIYLGIPAILFQYAAASANPNRLTAMSISSTNGNVGIGTTTPTSKLHVIGLPQYANNADAIAGGLTTGAFYRTGADPDPVCVVH